jgi:hypothetical protein
MADPFLISRARRLAGSGLLVSSHSPATQPPRTGPRLAVGCSAHPGGATEERPRHSDLHEGLCCQRQRVPKRDPSHFQSPGMVELALGATAKTRRLDLEDPTMTSGNKSSVDARKRRGPRQCTLLKGGGGYGEFWGKSAE